MILNFLHAGLRDIHLHGSSGLIPSNLHYPCRLRLGVLSAAASNADLGMHGLSVRPMAPGSATQFVGFMGHGILFVWNGSDAADVDFV